MIDDFEIIDNIDKSFGLTIYVISDSNEIKEFIKPSTEKNKKSKRIEDYWEVIPFPRKDLKDSIHFFEKRIQDLKSKKNNREFDDIFVIYVEGQEDPIIEDIFKELNEILDEDETYFIPFIIFLGIPKIKNLFQKYNKFNERKIFSYVYDRGIEKSEFKNRILKCLSYYRELGNYFSIGDKVYDLQRTKVFSTYINILLIGKTGAGKSTFINLILGDLLAKEGGQSFSTSRKITKYYIKDKPIIFYDTPGFEDDKTSNDVVLKIKELKNDILTTEKEDIHLVLYFVDGGATNKFLNCEDKVINLLNGNRIKTIFVVSHSVNDPYSKNENVQKDAENDKKTISKAIKQKFGEKVYNFFLKNGIDESIILANLKKKDCNRFTIEQFGIDIIVQSIYNYFKTFSPTLEELKSLIEKNQKGNKSTEGKINQLIKENFFLDKISNLDELGEKMESKCKFIIIKQTIIEGFATLIPIIDMCSHCYIKNSLKKQISDIYGYEINDAKIEEKEKDNQKQIAEKLGDIYYTDKIDKSDIEKEFLAFNSKADGEASKKKLSSWKNVGKIFIGLLLGGYFEFGINTGYGTYKMNSYGFEILEVYKKNFKEKKNYIYLSLVNALMEAIDYFYSLISKYKIDN